MHVDVDHTESVAQIDVLKVFQNDTLEPKNLLLLIMKTFVSLSQNMIDALLNDRRSNF